LVGPWGRVTVQDSGCRELSPEGEGVGLDAWFEKADLERVISDRPILANKLVEPLLVYDALAVGIDIDAMTFFGRHTINRDT
jgi:hypothetical protein